MFEQHERRDPAEVLPESLPAPIQYRSHRDFVRQVLRDEVNFSAAGTEYVHSVEEETAETLAYRDQLNSEGSPTETVAAGYTWRPGSEVVGMTRNGSERQTALRGQGRTR